MDAEGVGKSGQAAGAGARGPGGGHGSAERLARASHSTDVESARAVGFGDGDWRSRLRTIVETMREISRQVDPQEMVRIYGERMDAILPTEQMVSLSRRGMDRPWYRITRSSRWSEEVNPWEEAEKLPVLAGGLLGELLYGNEPRIIDEVRVSADDPAAEQFEGVRSLIAIPMYDQGEAVNMVVLMRERAAAFSREDLPEWVWMTNLFGRATHNLVLRRQVQKAFDEVDRELQGVAALQRSLLPSALPQIPGMELAAHYQTSRRAGGDYYDFFPLAEGKWGILIADVSGHGTPAAVLMAVTHSIAHTHCDVLTPAQEMLGYLNRQLHDHYTSRAGAFVTAFYGIYDPVTRELSYSSAGHNPPRLQRCAGGGLVALQMARGLPLGVLREERYQEATIQLVPADQLILYTDGITETMNPRGELLGTERLDEVLMACRQNAGEVIRDVLVRVEEFAEGRAADDDRTIVVARIS